MLTSFCPGSCHQRAEGSKHVRHCGEEQDFSGREEASHGSQLCMYAILLEYGVANSIVHPFILLLLTCVLSPELCTWSCRDPTGCSVQDGPGGPATLGLTRTIASRLGTGTADRSVPQLIIPGYCSFSS